MPAISPPMAMSHASQAKIRKRPAEPFWSCVACQALVTSPPAAGFLSGMFYSLMSYRDVVDGTVTTDSFVSAIARSRSRRLKPPDLGLEFEDKLGRLVVRQPAAHLRKDRLVKAQPLGAPWNDRRGLGHRQDFKQFGAHFRRVGAIDDGLPLLVGSPCLRFEQIRLFHASA